MARLGRYQPVWQAQTFEQALSAGTYEVSAGVKGPFEVCAEESASTAVADFFDFHGLYNSGCERDRTD